MCTRIQPPVSAVVDSHFADVLYSDCMFRINVLLKGEPILKAFAASDRFTSRV